MPTRRDFLAGLTGALSFGLPSRLVAKAFPFALGVASGEPSADGFVIWTRLAPEPFEPAGGMASSAVEVAWEVADDEQFSRVVRQGRTTAEPQWAHCVHVEVQGLQPDRWYWYRFLLPQAKSPSGRARTLPAAGVAVARLRLALASCQHFEQGYYTAYRHMAANAPDLVVHVGDYIYESARGGPVRSHFGGIARTLADYRMRYAQYRGDADLQAAHAACPWLIAWDDHEVQNDYAGGLSGDVTPESAFLRRRAAAYQADHEHMPLRSRARPRQGRVQLHHATEIGGLATLYMLDTRQHRDDQACSSWLHRGGRVLDDEQCPQRLDTSRSMLGAEQERWLNAQFSASRSQWNVLGQQLLMAPMDQEPGAGARWWSDAWEGYPAARRRLLQSLAGHKVGNPVVLSGDIHSYWVNELGLDGQALATEFVGTSISSQGVNYDRFAAMLADNPHVKFFESRLRGYVALELTPARLTARLMTVDDIANRASAVRVLKSFVVESGAARIQPA